MTVAMIRYSIALFLLMITLPKVESALCAACASPMMINYWSTTGYPVMSTRFTGMCDGSPTNIATESCSGPCIEMVIPIEGTASYAYIRGCLPTLLGQYSTWISNSNTSTTDSCVYHQSKIMVNVTASGDTGGIVPIMGYTAFRQCSDSSGDPTAVLTQPTGLKCSITSINTNCIECTQINDQGASCNKETTTQCQSAYCSKFQGSELITRGCSPYSPYIGTGCVWISQNISAPLPLSAIANGRRKRSVGLMLEGHQCFCTGDRCNGAGKVILMTLMPLLLCLLHLFA